MRGATSCCQMKNKILVTGASGFLGRHLVAALEGQGHIVKQHSSTDGDIATCQLPMDEVSHVFHLAAKSYVPDSWQDPFSFYRTNVMGTINVLEECRRGGPALTLISSYVYGAPQKLPITEDHPVSGFNPYAHTKIMAEQAARFYAEKFDVRVTIVRPFNIYGPGQRDAFLIPSIVRQILDPSIAVVQVKGLKPKRDYVYVKDAVALLQATLRPGGHCVYNLGSGRSVGVAEVVELANTAAGTEKPVMSSKQHRAGEILETVADCSRAAADFGWKPQVSFAEGISAMVKAERKSHA